MNTIGMIFTWLYRIAILLMLLSIAVDINYMSVDLKSILIVMVQH